MKPAARALGIVLACVALSLLGACATALREAAPAASGLFDDSRFVRPVAAGIERDPLEMSEAMRAYAASAVLPQARSKGLQRALIDALYRNQQLRLSYDASVTRDAREAFDARSGNCLSLVLMTAAFARHLGLEVQFNSITEVPVWSRAPGLVMASQHVNIGLGRRVSDAPGAMQGQWLLVDFLPPEDALGLRGTAVDESAVIAMYRNNRAVEALAGGRLDEAYWWSCAALDRDPGFLAAANTLGVVYRRAGADAAAERAFRHVLDREPDNAQALGNLESQLRSLGRTGEADALAMMLRGIEPVAPYHHFNLGMTALLEGRPAEAKRLFAAELRRSAFHHEFHFWLAVAHLQLGELKPARRHFEIALDRSPTAESRALARHKLDVLAERAAAGPPVVVR